MLTAWLGLVFLVFELCLRFSRRSDASASTGADRGSLRMLWITIGLALALAAFAPRLVPQANFALGVVGRRVAVLAFTLGLLLRAWAVARLGRFFTVDVAIAHDHALQTDGPYALVRHPSYTGLLVMFAALGTLFENGVSLALLLALVGIALARRIVVEEQALAGAFGAEWTAYAARTRRLVPLVYALLVLVGGAHPANAEVQPREVGGFTIRPESVVSGPATSLAPASRRHPPSAGRPRRERRRQSSR